jgi:uncharacterized membrane protein
MRRKNLDLVVAICIGFINIAWTRVPDRPVAPGILLVLPLTFLLPGYTLTEILLRARPRFQDFARAHTQPLPLRQPVGIADQLALSLGLSIAIDILLGFALNLLPVGLQASSWAIALALVTTAFALFAALLRRKHTAEIARSASVHVTPAHALLLCLAGIVIAASIWLTLIRPLDPATRFTQLWMLPAKNSECSVSIGVQSFEATSVAYRMVMIINNTAVHNWPSILLAPQQKWSQSVTVAPGHPGSLYIQALLYRADKPDTIYRSTHITLHVVASMNNGQIQRHCEQGGQAT